MKELRMHLRSNGQNFMQRQYVTPLLDGMTAHQLLGAPPGTATRLVITKKLCVWMSILLMQLGLICCYWLLQTDINNLESAGSANALGNNNLDNEIGKVNFITKLTLGRNRISKQIMLKVAPAQHANVNQFSEDFALKVLNINRSDAELAMALDITNEYEQQWCFIEGSANDSQSLGKTQQQVLEFDQCTCKPGWHGKDCGQPEIIWRALMTNRQHRLKLRKPQNSDHQKKNIPHRLIAFIEGNFINIDMLEMQLASLVKVVDYFMIFCKNHASKPNEYKSLQRRIHDMLQHSQYEVYHCSKYTADECNRERAFEHLRASINILQPTDLFLQLHERVVLATPPLKFFKYYAAEPIANVRFRLKYNVYGYFWQHPEQTYLNGLLSSFMHVDMGRVHATDSSGIIVGDLNHFGGWYCEYCMQPNELIAELLLLNTSSSTNQYQQMHVQFPNDSRQHNIDVDYVQKLIAMGQHLDGQTKLLKMHNRVDKYYAPAYAQTQSWKYGSYLVNLYEVLEEDSDELYGA